MYSIKEVSQLMGISTYTLRYYDKLGLLDFVSRDENGSRRFSKSNIVTLNTIYRLKETGMPLREIKHYLKLIDEGLDSVSERKRLMAAQQKKVKRQIDQLQKSLLTINAKLKYYEEAEKHHRLGVCHDEREQFIQRLLAGKLK